jgi:hypothetical protein
MGDADETLTLEEVTQIISQAKAGGANPLLIGMQIFSALGDNVTVTGDILKAAFATSVIPIPGPLEPLLDAVQSVSKTGNHLSIALHQDIETTLNDTRMQFKKEMSFDAIPTPSAPALNNITGVAAHKFVSWIHIQRIQLTQNLGRWSVAVVTSLKTVNFDLD